MINEENITRTFGGADQFPKARLALEIAVIIAGTLEISTVILSTGVVYSILSVLFFGPITLLAGLSAISSRAVEITPDGLRTHHPLTAREITFEDIDDLKLRLLPPPLQNWHWLTIQTKTGRIFVLPRRFDDLEDLLKLIQHNSAEKGSPFKTDMLRAELSDLNQAKDQLHVLGSWWVQLSVDTAVITLLFWWAAHEWPRFNSSSIGLTILAVGGAVLPLLICVTAIRGVFGAAYLWPVLSTPAKDKQAAERDTSFWRARSRKFFGLSSALLIVGLTTFAISLKYGISKTELQDGEWVRTIESPDTFEVGRVVTDRSGNAYVLGTVNTTTDEGKKSEDIFVTSYNPSGKQRWRQTIGGNGNESEVDIETGGHEGLYILGKTSSPRMAGETLPEGEVYFFARYTQSGKKKWTKFFDRQKIQEINDLTVVGKKQLYVLVQTSSSSTNSKKESTKNHFELWKYSIGGKRLNRSRLDLKEGDTPNSIAVGEDRSFYVSGVSSIKADSKKATSKQKAFLLKYRSDGSLQWRDTVQMETGASSATVRLDRKGAPILTALGGEVNPERFSSSVSLFARYIPSGQRHTTHRISAAGTDTAITDENRVFLAGFSKRGLDVTGIVIESSNQSISTKRNFGGRHWIKSLPPGIAFFFGPTLFDFLYSIAPGEEGSLYISGALTTRLGGKQNPEYWTPVIAKLKTEHF